jgi:hypothetical protein
LGSKRGLALHLQHKSSVSTSQLILLRRNRIEFERVS